MFNICIICKKEFKLKSYYKRKTCSKKCYKKFQSKLSVFEKNNNYKHGNTFKKKKCKGCNKLIKITRSSGFCASCRIKFDNPFSGKKHTEKVKKIIGKKSKEKFTKEYIEKNYRIKNRGKKHRDINGYVLIKDYDHPNSNSHHDILEHIKKMSDKIKRPLKKGEIVHHINFIRNDNRIKNLHLCDSISTHGKVTKSIFKLVKDLLELNIIKFKNGEYIMNKKVIGDLMIIGGNK